MYNESKESSFLLFRHLTHNCYDLLLTDYHIDPLPLFQEQRQIIHAIAGFPGSHK